MIHIPGWPFSANTLIQESKLALLRHVNMLSGFMTYGHGTSPAEIVLTRIDTMSTHDHDSRQRSERLASFADLPFKDICFLFAERTMASLSKGR